MCEALSAFKILISSTLPHRPYERSVTLVRDSSGQIGFQFKDGKIVNIVKDSSAARNGLLTEHNLLGNYLIDGTRIARYFRNSMVLGQNVPSTFYYNFHITEKNPKP